MSNQVNNKKARPAREQIDGMDVIFVDSQKSDVNNAAYAQLRLLNSPPGVVLKGPEDRVKAVANVLLKQLEYHICGVPAKKVEDRRGKKVEAYLLPILPGNIGG